MKKLLIFLLPGLILAGGGVAAASQYNTHQKKVNAVQAAQRAVAEQKAQAIVTIQKEDASLRVQYSALNIECQKGHASWDRLTLAVKKIAPEPNCGAAIVQ